MPPQAVTLEPSVQGEHNVAVFRLLGRTERAHQPRSIIFCWFEISAQGTDPLTNISEKFCSLLAINLNTSYRVKTPDFCQNTTLLKLRALAFGNPALLQQRLFNGLLQHANTLLHIRRVITGFSPFLRQLMAHI
ncbi:hypothetical protein EDC54_102194 [Samsonia erythrinae]|uniref:Uncharacterized protein n=1 Tax=Samsonia erythrinae TaxID=160434 RepID=A0A4R3VM45_9GAMM|nr:hypothetical protein EDC54_102194 [Samsonia erythrinae]